MALIIERNRGRLYTSPTTDHEAIALSTAGNPEIEEARATFLSAPTPTENYG